MLRFFFYSQFLFQQNVMGSEINVINDGIDIFCYSSHVLSLLFPNVSLVFKVWRVFSDLVK